MKLIDRLISSEVIRPFVLLILGFIVVMLSVRLPSDIDLVVNRSVPASIVAKTVLFKIPEFVVQGLPIAYLMATLLGLARMSKDYEITAIRASGTGCKRVMVPIFMMALIICGAAFLLNEEVVPRANKRSQLAQEAANKLVTGHGTTENLHFKGGDGRFFSIRAANKTEHLLTEVVIYDRRPAHPYRIISAQDGHWQGTRWKLRNGTVQEYAKGQAFATKEHTFAELEVDTRIRLENYLSGEINPKDMNAFELKRVIAETKEGGQDVMAFEVEYQAKFASPMATLFAAMIAAPIGLKFARGGYIGFAISIILTFFYFVAQSIGVAVGQFGFVSAEVAAWMPNIVFGLVGLIFMWQVE